MLVLTCKFKFILILKKLKMREILIFLINYFLFKKNLKNKKYLMFNKESKKNSMKIDFLKYSIQNVLKDM